MSSTTPRIDREALAAMIERACFTIESTPIPAELRSRVEQAEASAGPKAVISPLTPPLPAAPGGEAAGDANR